MNSSTELTQRLGDIIRRRNRALAGQAALKAGLGIAFSLITFGFLFWGGWFVGFVCGHYLGPAAWQFGLLFSGLFLAVATWSAWRQVNPMAGLGRLSDAQLLLTLLSPMLPAPGYFSPRHASAAFALALIGGPANLFQAFSTWAHRFRVDDLLLENAASILTAADTQLPLEQLRDLAAAVLLRDLALIKMVPCGDSEALTLTDKGRAVLSRGKGKRARQAPDPGSSKAKQRRGSGLNKE
jgi:hypothetical protein